LLLPNVPIFWSFPIVRGLMAGKEVFDTDP